MVSFTGISGNQNREMEKIRISGYSSEIKLQETVNGGVLLNMISELLEFHRNCGRRRFMYVTKSPEVNIDLMKLNISQIISSNHIKRLHSKSVAKTHLKVYG